MIKASPFYALLLLVLQASLVPYASADTVLLTPLPTPSPSPTPGGLQKEARDLNLRCTRTMLDAALKANPDMPLVRCGVSVDQKSATMRWTTPDFAKIASMTELNKKKDLNSPTGAIWGDKTSMVAGTYSAQRGGQNFNCTWKSNSPNFFSSGDSIGTCPKVVSDSNLYPYGQLILGTSPWQDPFFGNGSMNVSPVPDTFNPDKPYDNSSLSLISTGDLLFKLGVRKRTCLKFEITGKLVDFSNDLMVTAVMTLADTKQPDQWVQYSNHSTPVAATTSQTADITSVSYLWISNEDIVKAGISNSEFQARKKAVGATSAKGVSIDKYTILPADPTMCK